MSDEEHFQAMLDLHPDDHGTRLVFADWLRERGDPRAEGYHYLGANRRCPYLGRTYGDYAVPDTDAFTNECDHSELPKDLWRLVRKVVGGIRMAREYDWYPFTNRRHADDTVALAFAKLPEARRTELFQGVLV